MRRALLLASLLTLSVPVAAEPPAEDVLRPDVPSSARWYLEPHLGINYSFASADSVVRTQIPGEGNLDIYGSAAGLAPLIGLTLGYQLSPMTGIELDVSYDSRRASNSGATEDGCVVEDDLGNPTELILAPVEKEYTVGADYVSIGLEGTFTFDKVFLHLGPTISLPISSTFEETMRWSEEATECRYFFGTPDESIEVQGTPDAVEEAVRASFRVGLGARIGIADQLELVPRVGFDIGLTDLFDGGGGYTVRREGSSSENRFETLYSGAISVSSLQASLGLRILL